MPPPSAAEVELVAYAERQCDAERVEVRVLGVAQASLPSGVVQWSGDPCGSRPSLRLKVIDDGVVAFNASVRPELDVWVTRVVAAQRARPGDILRVEPGVVLMADIVGEPVPLGSGPWVARTNHSAGAPVTDRTASEALDRVAGDPVSVVVSRGALTLTAPGTLLADARVGDPVQVINEATRTRLKGTLITPDTVEVR